MIGMVSNGRKRAFGTVVVRRRKDGTIRSYLGRYSYHGDHVQQTFHDRDSALAWLEGERHLVDLDSRGLRKWTRPEDRVETFVHADAGDMLFVDYADEYMRRLRSEPSSTRRDTSLSRIENDVEHLKKAFPAPLRMKDFDHAMLADWYEHRRPASQWTFRTCCIRLRAMLRDAADPEREGGPLIENNPFHMPVPPEPEIESHSAPPITAQQLQALYEAFPDYSRISVLLAALAGGLRTGELCGLRVCDVDFESNQLHVRYSVRRRDATRGPWILGPTKTAKSQRTVPLPGRIIPLLKEHIRKYCGDDPESQLLVPRGEWKIMGADTLGCQMHVAREKIGRPDLTFRMLRASHATLYMLEGGTLREAMDQLGHSTEQVAVRHYQRIVPEHRRGVSERLADVMLATMLGPAAAPGVRLPGGAEHTFSIDRMRDLGFDPDDPVTVEQLERALLLLRDRLDSLERLLLSIPVPSDPAAA